MNTKHVHEPFSFCDFVRARERLAEATCQEEDPYLLLTGDTGVGKTALLKKLRAGLDRCRYRIIYFSSVRSLNPFGLIRVLLRTLRLRAGCSHPESAMVLRRHLLEEPQRLLVWLDDAHELPDATLDELRSLVESDLSAPFLLQVLLVGQTPLRERLQNLPSLWRRIAVREEITGLTQDELLHFLTHHFGDQANRFDDEGHAMLFEHGRGIPGLVVPVCRAVLRGCEGDDPIDSLRVEDLLQRWDLA